MLDSSFSPDSFMPEDKGLLKIGALMDELLAFGKKS
jgi:hypothetical protein